MELAPVEVECLLCERLVTAHPHDPHPVCESCQPRWEHHLVAKAYMDGELDHTIPELAEGGDDGKEGEEEVRD